MCQIYDEDKSCIFVLLLDTHRHGGAGREAGCGHQEEAAGGDGRQDRTAESKGCQEQNELQMDRQERLL